MRRKSEYKVHSTKIKLTILFTGQEYPESKAIYEQTNQRIEKYSEIIYVVVVKVTPVCFVVPKCMGSLLMYFLTDLGSEALKLPIPMWYVCYSIFSFFINKNLTFLISIFGRFPFDSRNLIGYLMAVGLEYSANALLYFFNAGLVPLAIGIFLFTLSMTEDIKNNLNSVNEMIKIKGTRPEIYKKITHSIRLHSKAKQLRANC